MKRKLDLILLIDDYESDNFIHMRIIKKLDITSKVMAIEDAREALNFLSTQENERYPRPDIIFLDINMPGMDGWEFLAEYQKLGPEMWGKIILIMLTTSVNPDDRKKAEGIGLVEGFLNKPLTQDTMLEILEKHFPEYR